MITLQQALTNGRGVERPFCCPAHDDSNASASVNTLKGVWYCYACHAHGTLTDHVMSIDQAISILAGTEPARIYSEQWLDIYDAHYVSPYWKKRVGHDVAENNRCGTDPITGAPTYPLRDSDGNVTGVVTRHDANSYGPKYKYPYGTATSRTLFGRLVYSHVVVLVEGAGDVMAIEQSGLPDGWTVVGCYGAGLHHVQSQLVARLDPKVVIAAFDDDGAGQAANERAHQTLNQIAPVVSHPWGTVGGKDAAEIPLNERTESLRRSLTSSGYKKYA